MLTFVTVRNGQQPFQRVREEQASAVSSRTERSGRHQNNAAIGQRGGKLAVYWLGRE